MPLETGTYISDLVVTNPAHTDGLNNADAHLRLLKAALKATFPNINGAVNLTDEQLNLLAGDGSSGAPTYSFPSEPTLGFYRLAAAIIGFTGLLRGNGAVPAGAIMAFGMNSAPTGWVTCDGQAVGRTDPVYVDLFAKIGTTWGVGDGSTTFNLPWLSSRYLRHRDGNATFAGNVGNLQGPQIFAHTHSFAATTGGESVGHTHGFSWSGTTGGMNANNPHSHGLSGTVNTNAGNFNNNGGGGGSFSATSSTAASINNTDIDHGHGYSGSGTTGGVSSDHTHGVSGTTGSTGDANDLRPYSATVCYCIKL